LNLAQVKVKVEKIKQELVAIYYAFRHPGVGVLPKIIIALALGYALSPIDLIPDFIPVIGYLDDLIILPALITLALKLIPPAVMEACRDKALHKPLTLRKNWIAGVVFIVIWIVLIGSIVFAIHSYK